MPTWLAILALLLDSASDTGLTPSEHNRNVYALNPDDTVRWQVEEQGTQALKDSFVSLNLAGNRVLAHRFFGHECEINIVDGSVTVLGWHK
jgi:hypothetical protein